MQPIRVTVQSNRQAYPVQIEYDLLERLPDLLRERDLPPDPFVVSSPLVWRLHGETLRRSLPRARSILVQDGERHKTPQTVMRIYDALIQAEADRSSAMLALGGGVIGDMAGFAAATFLRGIRLAQIPTTLLAQVDSAIGGKVGVNHPLGKNLIGAFYPPELVAVDPRVLDTLPRREFRAGLYEVVKYGVIASPDVFRRLQEQMTAIFERRPEVLVPLVADSCGIKAQVVSADERESGLRRTLNFGHTLGHALEAVTKYKRFRHGEAIAYGMLAAAEIAAARGSFARPDQEALRGVIVKMGPLPPVADLKTRDVLDCVKRDKKVVERTLHFVLPVRIGATAIAADVTEKEMARALKKLGMRV